MWSLSKRITLQGLCFIGDTVRGDRLFRRHQLFFSAAGGTKILPGSIR
jgi:hypothetical protein